MINKKNSLKSSYYFAILIFELVQAPNYMSIKNTNNNFVNEIKFPFESHLTYEPLNRNIFVMKKNNNNERPYNSKFKIFNDSAIIKENKYFYELGLEKRL